MVASPAEMETRLLLPRRPSTLGGKTLPRCPVPQVTGTILEEFTRPLFKNDEGNGDLGYVKDRADFSRIIIMYLFGGIYVRRAHDFGLGELGRVRPGMYRTRRVRNVCVRVCVVVFKHGVCFPGGHRRHLLARHVAAARYGLRLPVVCALAPTTRIQRRLARAGVKLSALCAGPTAGATRKASTTRCWVCGGAGE